MNNCYGAPRSDRGSAAEVTGGARKCGIDKSCSSVMCLLRVGEDGCLKVGEGGCLSWSKGAY